MIDRLTDGARKAMAHARKAAMRLRHDFIGTEHILLGLLDSRENEATAALMRLGIDLAALRRAVEESAPPGDSSGDAQRFPFTHKAKRALEQAMTIAMALGDDHIGGEHLVLALLAEGQGVAARTLERFASELRSRFADIIAALGKALPQAIGSDSRSGLEALFGWANEDSGKKGNEPAPGPLEEARVILGSLAILEGLVEMLPAGLPAAEDLRRAWDSLARALRERHPDAAVPTPFWAR